MKLKLKKGFTLIEMMLVILIIGILMYILLPKSSIFPSNEMTLGEKLGKLGAGYSKMYSELSNTNLTKQDIANGFAKTIGSGGTIQTINFSSDANTVKLLGLNEAKSSNIYDLDKTLGVSPGYTKDFENIVGGINKDWDVAWYYVGGSATTDVNDNPVFDNDYGGILACAIHNKEKYAYFKATGSKRYLSCVALSLDGTYEAKKTILQQAFGTSVNKVETATKIPSYKGN